MWNPFKAIQEERLKRQMRKEARGFAMRRGFERLFTKDPEFKAISKKIGMYKGHEQLFEPSFWKKGEQEYRKKLKTKYKL